MQAVALTVSRIAQIVDTSTSAAFSTDRIQRKRLAMMTNIPVVSQNPYMIFLFCASVVHSSMQYALEELTVTMAIVRSTRGAMECIK